MRRLLLALMLPSGLAFAATPEPAVELMPGVTFEQQVEFTPHGPGRLLA